MGSTLVLGSESMVGAELVMSVMDAVPDPVIAVGSDTSLLWGNRAAAERYGAPLDHLIGHSMVDWIHPDDLHTALLSMVSVLDKEVGTPLEIRIRDVTGNYSWFEVRGRGWDDGPEGAVVLSLREVTERRKWEISHGDTEMLGAVLDSLPVVAMVLDLEGTIRGGNRAVTRALQRDLETVKGQLFEALVADEDLDRVREDLVRATREPGTWQLEARLVRADGTEVPMALSVVNLLDDRAVQGLLVTAADITPLVLARRELHRRANTDDLTGLPNRGSLRLHLERVLQRGPDHTVLFADVDDLKVVNDRFGHRAGDTVLCAIARRLRAVCDAGDFVARISGDEFVVVAATAHAPTVARLVKRIEQVMQEPVVLIDGRRVPASMSIGVSDVAPSLTADDLLASADAAMYVAKRDRGTD